MKCNGRINRMNETTRYEILRQREVLKGYKASDAIAEVTDQEQKLPSLEPVKEPKGTEVIELPMDFSEIVAHTDLLTLIQQRTSVREYEDTSLSLQELSYLLWATQGVRKIAGRKNHVTFRNVPSAGSRHAFETYLFIRNVKNLEPGIYHYLADTHRLEVWEKKTDYEQELTQALGNQYFAASAPVVFVWSAVPYRMEWRYGLKSHKYMAMDAGHMCENLYLACGSISCGTCAIGAYDQDKIDELLGFAPGPSAEQNDEFVIYAAPVGKLKKEVSQ